MSRFRELIRLADSYAERGHGVELLGTSYLRVTDNAVGNVYFVNYNGTVSYALPEGFETVKVVKHKHYPHRWQSRRVLPSNGRRVNHGHRRQS